MKQSGWPCWYRPGQPFSLPEFHDRGFLWPGGNGWIDISPLPARFLSTGFARRYVLTRRAYELVVSLRRCYAVVKLLKNSALYRSAQDSFDVAHRIPVFRGHQCVCISAPGSTTGTSDAVN